VAITFAAVSLVTLGLISAAWAVGSQSHPQILAGAFLAGLCTMAFSLLVAYGPGARLVAPELALLTATALVVVFYAGFKLRRSRTWTFRG
jgi:hypothetical protein